MHQTFVLVRDIFERSAPGKPASHFEKKQNWPGDWENGI